jgi:hypothetical protein
MKLFLVIASLFFLCFQSAPVAGFAPVLEHSKIPSVQQCNCDSLKTDLFVARYKIERVRYYLKICKRNPSQTKFLVSWINRAIQ